MTNYNRVWYSNGYLSGSEEHCVDPLPLLYSDSDGMVDIVRVSKKDSKPQCVTTEVQGVSISDIIDTGVDITIMGGELFKKFVATARLRRKTSRRQTMSLILMIGNSLNYMEEWI